MTYLMISPADANESMGNMYNSTNSYIFVANLSLQLKPFSIPQIYFQVIFLETDFHHTHIDELSMDHTLLLFFESV